MAEGNPQSSKKSVEGAPDELSEAFGLLGAHNVPELVKLYDAEDQRLIRAGKWDYDDPTLLINQVKKSVSAINLEALAPSQRWGCEEM